MPRALRDSVVVVTGASSGIGRATAHAFARAGTTLVLAARRPEALGAVLRECEELGGRGLAVPTDVGDAGEVDRLAERAVGAYDRIDAWVNNGAVSLFGRLEETPREAYERVVRTILLGCVNGARAAIRQFREQGEGLLVNVSSMVGLVGQPYTSAYATTKWAIRGLSECLRMELQDAPGIRVATVLPASIDTPIFQHAANYTGRATKAMRPVYPPEQVAATIVDLATRPRREVFVGNAGRALALLRTLVPGLAEALVARQVDRDHFQDGWPAAPTDGNLFQPASGNGRGSVRGGWIEREHPPERQRSAVGLAALGFAAVALPLGLYALAQQRAR